MILLAVETSGMDGSLALVNRVGEIIPRELRTSGRRHAQSLVAEVDELLREQELAPSDVEAVAVSIGPGSFTGLRVGVTFAKTFAWINNAQLTAVDTLQAIAQQCSAADSIVTTVIDAQRNEVFAATYRRNPVTGICERGDDIRITTLGQLDASVPLAGPVLVKQEAELRELFRLTNPESWFPRATTIALIGLAQIQRGIAVELAKLEPVYLRRSYAEEKRPTAEPPAA